MLRGVLTFLRPFVAAVAVAAVACGALPAAAGAGRPVTLAVAANFLTTAEAAARAYTQATGLPVRIAHGSTGRLYAQIVAGAPFDLFLAADAERPARLAAEGRALATATYALGRLVLVARAGPDAPDTLRAGDRVAIADPAVAPYGVAALEAIAALGLDPGQMRFVYGDSVGQTAALLVTGNVEFAFLAASQLPDLGAAFTATPLEGAHAPIRQDLALLAEAGRPFHDWLLGPGGRAVVAQAGYGLP